jgi:hypothetical protein
MATSPPLKKLPPKQPPRPSSPPPNGPAQPSV